MSVISKGRHDIVIKQEGKVSGGFFKVTKKHYPMYPFKEEKIKVNNYYFAFPVFIMYFILV